MKVRETLVEDVDVLSPRPRPGKPRKAEGLRAPSTTPKTHDNAPRLLDPFTLFQSRA